MQVGCGADELIDLLMRCVLEPGDAIVDCPPTFTMYAFDADVNDGRVITVPRLDGFKIDVEGVRSVPPNLHCKRQCCSMCEGRNCVVSQACRRDAQAQDGLLDFTKQPRWQHDD